MYLYKPTGLRRLLTGKWVASKIKPGELLYLARHSGKRHSILLDTMVRKVEPGEPHMAECWNGVAPQNDALLGWF